MALIHMDGFDVYSALTDLGLQYTIANGGFGTTTGRFGGGAYYCTSYTATMKKALPSSPSEIWTSYAFNAATGINSDCMLIEFGGASGGEVSISINFSSGIFKAWRGTTLIGTSGAYALGTGTWHWLDYHFKINGSSGIVEIWLDGNNIMNLTGVNTSNSGGTAIVYVALASGSNSNNTQTGYFDDWIINDTTGSYNNGRIGDSRIETLKPTSDASPNNGTLTSGTSHYAMVNESHYDGDTSTITLTNTSGQEELFGIGSLSGAPASISAVKVTLIGKKSDAGACNLETVVSSSSTVSTGASTGLTTSYVSFGTILETDPHTSAAWAYTAVNAAKIGFEVP